MASANETCVSWRSLFSQELAEQNTTSCNLVLAVLFCHDSFPERYGPPQYRGREMKISHSQDFKKIAARRCGQSIVEFSLVAPLLLMIVTGAVSFGLNLYDEIVLTNAVSIGAQTLALSRGQTSDPCATAVSAIESAAPTLTSSNLSFKFALNGTNYTSTSCTSGA